MRSALLALVCFVLVAPAAAAARPPGFNFADLAEDRTTALAVRTVDGEIVRLETTRPTAGELVIAGRRTGLAWRGTPIAAYRLGHGGLLIHDWYDGTYRLWRWDGHRLVALGQGTLLQAVGLGRVILQDPRIGGVTRTALLDVDPATGRLRALWRARTAPCWVHAVAPTATGLRAVVERAGSFSVVTLAPGRPPAEIAAAEIAADLGAFRPAPGIDRARGDRLLVVAPAPAGLREGQPYEVPAGILDLATGRVRRLGAARGGWTEGTAIGHPTVCLSWVRAAAVPAAAPCNLVIEETERLLP
ncbi:MAG TPA: hypothetical protein VGQ83_20835 [Polyangia bacterium]|jgi:hypothetical protein